MSERELCECGCGKKVTKKGNRFLVGHWVRINPPMENPKIVTKMATTIKKRWECPDVKAMYVAIQNCADIKAKKSIAMKRRYQEGYRNPMSGVERGKDHPMWGRHHSEETKRKISQSVSGKKHWNWQGGISAEPYGFEFNYALKQEIRKRDKYICMLCFIPENGRAHDIHHIDHNKKNNQKSNLIALCRSCNNKVDFNYVYWEIFFREIQCQREIK